MTSCDIIFIENLRFLMKDNHITQAALHEQLGVAYQTLNKWLNGKTMPSLNNLDNIAEIFNITVGQLLTEGLDRSSLYLPRTLNFDPTENYTKFYHHLFGEDSRVPENIVMVVNKVAMNNLSEKDWDIVRKRYNLDGRGETKLVDISGEYGLSKQRIAQIVYASEDKLRYAHNAFYRTEREIINNDYSQTSDTQSEAHTNDAKTEIKDQITNEVIQSVLESLASSIGIHIEREHKSETSNVFTDIVIENAMHIPVIDLDEYLSVRVRDILMRNNCQTLGALLTMPEKKLVKFRGIGPKAIHEIRAMKEKINDSSVKALAETSAEQCPVG